MNNINMTNKIDKLINNTYAKQIFFLLIFLIIIFLFIGYFYYNTTKDIDVITKETLGLFHDTEKKIMSPSILNRKNLKETYILYMTIDNDHGNKIFNYKEMMEH